MVPLRLCLPLPHAVRAYLLELLGGSRVQGAMSAPQSRRVAVPMRASMPVRKASIMLGMGPTLVGEGPAGLDRRSKEGTVRAAGAGESRTSRPRP